MQASTFKQFFLHLPDLLCVANFDGFFEQVNPAFSAALGWQESELLGRPFLELVHPQDRQRTLTELEQLAQGQTTLVFDNRYLCQDGRYTQLRWTAYPDLDQQVIYASARDITEMHKAQQIITESEARFRAITESSPLGIFVTVGAHGCIYANNTYLSLSGLNQQTVQGKGWRDAIHPDDRSHVNQGANDAYKQQKVFRDEFRFHRSDGSDVWAKVTAAPITIDDELNGFVGIVGVNMRHITQVSHGLAVSVTPFNYVFSNRIVPGID